MEKKTELIEYWAKSSDDDFNVAKDLSDLKRYPQALFFCHLSIEKLLKALFISILDDYPPKTHNLLTLVKNINIEVPENVTKALIEINTFNIEARYPDEKFGFYQRCTPEFTKQYIYSSEDILKWLKEKL